MKTIHTPQEAAGTWFVFIEYLDCGGDIYTEEHCFDTEAEAITFYNEHK